MIEAIYVEAGDSLPAVLLRLGQVSSRRAALVVADDVTWPANEVRLDLISREAARRLIDLAVVTRNLALYDRAAGLGLPVFSSLRQAEEAPVWATTYEKPELPGRDEQAMVPAQTAGAWLRRAREPGVARARNRRILQTSARRERVWLQALGLLLLLAVLGGMVVGTALLVVPVGTVTVVPSEERILASVNVRASPATEQVDLSNGLIPARRIEVLVEETRQMPTTGRRDVPDKPARGSVTFINQRSQAVTVPAGTLVRTSTGNNVRFKTLADVNVPAGIGGQATAQVEAVDAGPAGNVPAGTVNRVDSSLGVGLRVINAQGMGGGTVRQGGTVTAADKERLRVTLQQQLQQEAYQRLSEELEQGEFVPPESVETIVMSLVYDAFTDDARDSVGLTMRLLARAIAVNGQTGDDLALRALQDQMPPGSRLLADSIQYTTNNFTVLEENTLKVVAFNVQASGTVVGDVDSGRIRAAVAGLEPAAAQAVLTQEFDLKQPPVVSVTPDWLGRLPIIPFRVRVEVNYAGAVASNQ